MKTLLKSALLTQSIIDSVRFTRNYWIVEKTRLNGLVDISEKDKDFAISMCNNSINECNAVLDAMGLD